MDTDEAEDDRGLHAHPDDEALFTSGTMAKAAAAGHRVVLVLATDGGITRPRRRTPMTHGDWDPLRLAEAQASADALGVAKIEWLGYADSGSGRSSNPTPSDRRFARARLRGGRRATCGHPADRAG